MICLLSLRLHTVHVTGGDAAANATRRVSKAMQDTGRLYASGFDAAPALSNPLRVPAAERTYGRQFAQVYDYRLAVLRRRVLAAAEAASEAPLPYVERILDVPAGKLCFVIGTLYAAMPRKPDVLQEIARDHSLAPQPIPTSYADAERDELFIEDQSGRVRLVGDAIRSGTRLAQECVTGVVAGVFGVETPEGDLEVTAMQFPGPPAAPAPEKLPRAGDAPAPHIALLSGLAVGAEASLAHDLLAEWLTGELGQDAAVRSISSAVLAGNSVPRAEWTHLGAVAGDRHKAAAASTHNPLADLDPLLERLCASLETVLVVPGAEDPCSTTLPQQPLLRPLLPRSARWASLQLATNPTWATLHARTLLCTGGQNVEDLVRYLPEEREAVPGVSAQMQMALATLQWAHMAPSAPDTLWCYPFKASDPFVLRASPDVYVVGNMPAFESAVVDAPCTGGGTRPIRVVLVPSFHERHEVVLLNAETLECRVVRLPA